MHGVLAVAAEHRAAGRLDEAERLLLEALAEDGSQQAAAIGPLANLWLAQDREPDAKAAIVRYLSRPRFWPLKPNPGKPRVTLLASVADHHALRIDETVPALSVSFIRGHFDAFILLRKAPLEIGFCFLPGPDEDLAPYLDVLRDSALVINTITDPDEKTEATQSVMRLCANLSVPVLNAPDRVVETKRDHLPGRADGVDGLVVPLVNRVAATQTALMRRLELSADGIIVRDLRSHAGDNMHLLRSRADVKASLPDLEGRTLFAIDYHDFRGSDNLYTKYRMYRIGDHLLPMHRIAKGDWKIHNRDRYERMDRDGRLRDLEVRFIEDPAGMLGRDALGALETFTAQAGLSYLGTDFTQLPDGRLLLFESNPAMRIGYDNCHAFPHLAGAIDRIAEQFCAHVMAYLRSAGPS